MIRKNPNMVHRGRRHTPIFVDLLVISLLLFDSAVVVNEDECAFVIWICVALSAFVARTKVA